MLLWNDYEGKTVAEGFPLDKLLRPEGRTAFFTTPRPDGHFDILRLTESADDQDELLAPWQQVVEADQPNLITIKRFGRTTFDGVPLTYALMESTDASLTEILAERPLTPTETSEVAIAVTSALSTLHSLQLTHGHIVPASIFACAETIKLRSDCVRECVPHPDFCPESECQARRQQDIHDLGVLLLECLTLEKTLNPAMRLPAPFNLIVPCAIQGTWTLEQIAEALTPPAQAPVQPPLRPQVQAPAQAPGQPAIAGRSAAAQPVVDAYEEPETIPTAYDRAPLTLGRRQLDFDYDADEHATGRQIPAWARNPRLWMMAAAALLLVVVLVWAFSGPSKSAAKAPVVTAVAPPPVKPTAYDPPIAAATPAPRALAGTAAGWHVVAYTYNREAQAFGKAAQLKARHPGLDPQVFAAGGHGPWFVALGGAMSREQAETVLRRARRDGLPRDTFVRNFPAR